MRRWTKNSIRCVLAILLYFFAVTADVIVKAVVSDGYDANNPIVQIEHKCAGHWGKVTQKADCSVPDAALVPAAPVPVTSLLVHGLLLPLQRFVQVYSVSPGPPLRC
jgi:hypothetical protein